MCQRYTTDEFLKVFEALKTFTTTQEEHGITRIAYSAEDNHAHNFLIKKMNQYGLTTRQDSMGNVFARLLGKNSDLPAIGTGSHLDSVPNGGAYDGVLGVIAGLYAILQFKPAELERDIELIVFRAEESSRFGCSCIGSKAMTGHIDTDKWHQNLDDNGISIFQALQNLGYQSEKIDQCLLANDYLDSFVELHIEQGKCLEQAHRSIGIVHGIAAPKRFEIHVTGHADHSGTTPMGIRSDALVASAEIIKNIHEAACKESVKGTVGTVGKLNTYPNAMNVIPGNTNFYVDIRGINKNSIDNVVNSLYASIKKAKTDNNVKIDLRQISDEQPILLNDNICSIIEESCKSLECSYMKMVSGAGHDTMYMAKRYPSAMIFIPSTDGVSHHPDEYSSVEDMILAANLLSDVIKKLANKQVASL